MTMRSVWVSAVLAAAFGCGTPVAEALAGPPVTRQVLRPGQGAIVTRSAGSAAPRVQVIDPAEPLRLIVQFDAAPAAAARLQPGGDTGAPARLAARLRLDLGALAMRAGRSAAAEVTREYSQAFSGAAVTLDRALEADLRALPYVRAVFLDDTVHTCDAPSNALVGADRVRNELGATGAGVRIGIIDTGVDWTHPAFGGGFGPGHRIAGGWDFVSWDADPMDDHGHGTHVAGIAAGNGGGVVGAATQATLYAYKVLDQYGSGYDSAILAAFERVLDPDQNPATDDALDLINCSFGSSSGDPVGPLSQAIDALTEAGVLCCVAAGNDYHYFTIGEPGAAREALTVGASDSYDDIAAFSSRGPVGANLDLKPDLVAPGVQIESAALGGGTVRMSGTSMATPLVAGVAAQLLQLHPDWGPRTVKAALVGSAADLGVSPFEQGAGRLRAYAAAQAAFVVVPSHVAFGAVNLKATISRSRDTLEVRNLQGQSRSIRVTAPLGFADGASVSAASDPVVVGPFGTARVPVLLQVTNAQLPFPAAEPYGFGQALTVTDGSESRRVPFTFHKGMRIGFAEANSPPGVTWYIATVFREDGEVGFSRSRGQTGTVLVPPGAYGYITTYQSAGRALAHAPVALQSDTTFVFDASEATVHADFAHVDAAGAPLADGRLAFGIVHKATGLGFVTTGFTASDLWVNPLPPDFHSEWSRAWSDDYSSLTSIAGTLDGLTGPHTFTNTPADLRHVRVEIPGPRRPGILPLVYRLHSFGEAFGYFGLGVTPPLERPVAEARVFDWWGTMEEALPLAHMGIEFQDWQWDGTQPPRITGEPEWLSPALDIEHGWPMTLAPWTTFHPGPVTFRGERLRFGIGAPVWRGSFRNETGQVRLHADAPLYYYTLLHLVADAYSGVGWQPDLNGTLRQGGTTLFDGPIPGSGSLLDVGPWTRTVSPAALTFRSGVDWTLAGEPARLDVAAAFDLRKTDRDPPALAGFYLYADGAVAESIAFARAADAGVRWRVLDADTLFGGTLEVRAHGTDAWTALASAADGDARISRFPPTLSGAQDVRLTATDAAGNSATWTWTPAFVAEPTVSVVFATGDAVPEADGVHVTWSVASGAGLRFLMERGEGGAAWERVGEAVADGAGVIAFVDRDAVPGATYRYRALLPNGGTPAYSRTVEITTPGVPRVAFGRWGANPVIGPGLDVEFSLAGTAPARLELFDIGGRRLLRSDVAPLGPGTHRLTLDLPAGARSGVYFLQLRQAGASATRRICVVR